MRFAVLHLCFVAVVLLSQSHGQEAVRSNLEERLRDEAPLGWKRIETKHGETRFDWKEKEIDNSQDEQKTHTASGSNCYRGSNFVVLLGKTERSYVWAGNDRYLFTVTRNANDRPWTLGHFGPRAGASGLNGDVRYGVQCRVPWCIYDVPFYLLTADPSFKIETLTTESDGSVDLQFSVSPKNGDDRRAQLTSGRVLLLPEQDWAIKAYEATLTRPSHPKDSTINVLASVVYGPKEETYLNIKHVEYELRWHSGGKDRSDKWKSEVESQHCDEPLDSFFLASYGLSEPALLGDRTKSRPWVWLNIIAIFCMLVALILRSRLKTREASCEA